MKRILLTLLPVLCLLQGIAAQHIVDTTAVAPQNKEKTPIFSKPKFSGFAMVSYQATFQKTGNTNTFDIRLVRAAIEGRIINDFYYKIQGQINGNFSTIASSPRLVDYFMEWQKLEFLKIRVGQFKRPFTFENPMNPIDQGFMSYSQSVSKLSGFSDRSGEHASNGRDIGVQLQGDFLKNGSGRNLLHYQVGMFNGQGINVKDVDNKKDIIGGIWVMPIAGMRIGVFGWEGSYARKNGNEKVSLNKHRYALSAEYKKDDLQLRAEYIHSTGLGFAITHQKSEDANDLTIKTYTDKEGNEIANNKADGFYALAIVPLIKSKLMAKARYDVYRPTATWGLSKTNYEVGLNFRFCKYFEVQGEYVFTNDRSLENHNYSSVFVQFSVRY